MSMMSEVVIQCPQCGCQQRTTVWQSLNATLNPEAREALMAGRINIFRCPCGFGAALATPLLYHDMWRQFLVQYQPADLLNDPSFLRCFDAQGVLAAPDSMLAAGSENAPGFASRIHLVFQMSELVYHIKFRESLYDHHRGKTS